MSNEALKTFKDTIHDICVEIAKEYDCPETIFTIKKNPSKKHNRKWHFKIELNELSFPYDKNNKITKTTLVLYKTPNTEENEIMIRKDRFDKIDLPDSAKIINKGGETDLYKYISFQLDDPSFYQYIKENLRYRINSHESSNTFSCCSKYKECSDKKKCIHINQLYAKGCQYRNNLENGRIFY